MIILYDLIFILIALAYLPVYLIKGKFHKGFASRLGVLPKSLELNNPIWVHAVSVGEAMAVRQLVDKLRLAYPSKKFVFSTVTATGNKIVKAIAKDSDLVIYLPLDLSFIVSKVVGRVRPAAFIIAETEIWPNLISCLSAKNIPVVLINGRISDSSFKGYSLVKLILRGILNKVSLFCVQTQTDVKRLISLGVDENRIRVTGNLKFDIKPRRDSRDNSSSLRQKLGINAKDKVFIAGSTHANEEAMILRVYKGLFEVFPGLRLLIAPRHPERAPEIDDIVSRSGFNPVRISGLAAGNAKGDSARAVFILDTIGQLADFYSIADLVFVGGSLVKKGGHNILEPAVLGKAVIFGPFMFNFRDIADLFLSNGAACSVSGEEELKKAISLLLKDPRKIEELGAKAGRLIVENQGATERTLGFIRDFKI
ncbi:MAG: 3-deoxy-D-manno-octulosonic acid transferase [Candidatus Omnitrophica bacterium]|nr:3-deoxy-D-manno-octulosonic acid transferase [Candidatus Omnitrophota bacterium]